MHFSVVLAKAPTFRAVNLFRLSATTPRKVRNHPCITYIVKVESISLDMNGGQSRIGENSTEGHGNVGDGSKF